jgi:hypothetical protein
LATGSWLVITVGDPGVPIFNHLQEIVPMGLLERGEAPVVEDQNVRLGQPRKELGVRSFRSGERELIEQTQRAQSIVNCPAS